jgi:hypothetical protein
MVRGRTNASVGQNVARVFETPDLDLSIIFVKKKKVLSCFKTAALKLFKNNQRKLEWLIVSLRIDQQQTPPITTLYKSSISVQYVATKVTQNTTSIILNLYHEKNRFFPRHKSRFKVFFCTDSLPLLVFR